MDISIDKIKGVLIALFFGEFGGYRFYRHQYFLGIVYLFTFGLFGFGWFYDVYAALTYDCNNCPAEENTTVITTIHTKVVGVSFECDHGIFDDRQEAIEALSCRWKKKNSLSLEYFEYKGEPAFYVIMTHDNTDIGCLKADLSSELMRKYGDCTFVISDYEVTGGEDRKKFGCNITIQVFQTKNPISNIDKNTLQQPRQNNANVLPPTDSNGGKKRQRTFNVVGIKYHMNVARRYQERNPLYKLSVEQIIEKNLLNKDIYEHVYSLPNITFEYEPENEYDHNAVKVLADGSFIGYIARQKNLKFKEIYESGRIKNMSCKMYGGKYFTYSLDKTTGKISHSHGDSEVVIKITFIYYDI